MVREKGEPLGVEPILFEADDYLGPETELLMARVCDRVPGLGIESVIYSWQKATPDEIAAMLEPLQQAQKAFLFDTASWCLWWTRHQQVRAP